MVAAPLALAAVERRAVADRDERVLQAQASRVMRVDVAGRDDRDSERFSKLLELRVPAGVATLVRPLQLDVERARNARASSARAFGSTTPRPWRAQPESATSPSACSLEHLDARLGGEQVALLPRHAGARVRVGEDAAEIRVAALRLAEQRDVCAAVERHLSAGDRADAEVLRGMRELERPVDAVVVGERERVVAELGGAGDELLRAATRRRGTSTPSARAARRTATGRGRLAGCRGLTGRRRPRLSLGKHRARRTSYDPRHGRTDRQPPGRRRAARARRRLPVDPRRPAGHR